MRARRQSSSGVGCSCGGQVGKYFGGDVAQRFQDGAAEGRCGHGARSDEVGIAHGFALAVLVLCGVVVGGFCAVGVEVVAGVAAVVE